jgi:hypothetical protein
MVLIFYLSNVLNLLMSQNHWYNVWNKAEVNFVDILLNQMMNKTHQQQSVSLHEPNNNLNLNMKSNCYIADDDICIHYFFFDMFLYSQIGITDVYLQYLHFRLNFLSQMNLKQNEIRHSHTTVIS